MLSVMEWRDLAVALGGAAVFALALFVLSRSRGGT